MLMGTSLILVLTCLLLVCWRGGNKTCQFYFVLVSVVCWFSGPCLGWIANLWGS